MTCHECGHHHPVSSGTHVTEGEWMCNWCMRGDYRGDPLGDYRAP